MSGNDYKYCYSIISTSQCQNCLIRDITMVIWGEVMKQKLVHEERSCKVCGSHNLGIDSNHMEKFCRDCGAVNTDLE